MGLQVRELTTEYMTDPIGLDEKRPRFSWKLSSTNHCVLQKTARIIVTSEDNTLVWDSGFLADGESDGICYAGDDLRPCTRYHWEVQVWDNCGEAASGQAFFETGFLDTSLGSWDGAQWIGPDHCTVSPDVRGVFGISAKIKISEGCHTAGIVFGEGDRRIPGRKNYYRYDIDVTSIPASLRIFRVGIAPEDSEEIPLAAVPILDYDDINHAPVITDTNAHSEHCLDIEVTGNNAYASVDGKRIDVCKIPSFMGEVEGPRVLNPLGNNDVNTFPRLNHIGFYVPAGETAVFSELRVRNLRTPGAVIYEHAEKTQVIGRDGESTFLLFDPSKLGIPLLRTEINLPVEKKVKKARVYITARGIYDLRVNGERVSDTYFNPGLTQYDHHIMYQTWDVTGIMHEGKNAIGIILASGWWDDAQTFVLGNYNYFGDRESVLAKITVTMDDGSEIVTVSDPNRWKYSSDGPWTYAGLFHGEHYDARRRKIGEQFSDPDFDDSMWGRPDIIAAVPIDRTMVQHMGPICWPEVNMREPAITGQIGDGVRVSGVIEAKSIIKTGDDVYLCDMGVNVAGVPWLHLYGNRDQTATMRYSEILYPDLPEYEPRAGTLMRENLRDADCTDLYTFEGKIEGEDYSPLFTFRGYRYIEISGVTKAPARGDVRLLVLSSVPKLTGTVHTSNSLINRLIDNVRRSQQSNFISIPTDCPQRNERMGWDGDTSIFSETAALNADTRLFYRRWLQSMRDLQNGDGKYPDIAPVGGGFGGYTYESAALHVTWNVYQAYGDKRIVEENYDSMKKFMTLSEKWWSDGENLARGLTLGDWLAPEETDLSLICHCFYGYNAYIMAHMAEAIGKADDAADFKALYQTLKSSFKDKYFDRETGRTRDDTQCSYALPLSFHMLDKDFARKAGANLARVSRERGYLVNTGFYGTAPLLPMLTRTGHENTAARLMLQTECPSWLYPVTQGATSVWERWDSYTEENGFGGHNNMNSFDHYSLGAVLAWFYTDLLGIRQDVNSPGYRHFMLKPSICAVDEITGGIETPYGGIRASWRKMGHEVEYTVTVPENTTADVILPDGYTEQIGSGTWRFMTGLAE